MKYLYNFSVDEFNEFVEESKIDNWWIYNNTIEERHKAISNKDYYKTLRKMAKKNKITFNEAEIVSWIDGLSMMYSSLEYAIDNDAQQARVLVTNPNLLGFSSYYRARALPVRCITDRNSELYSVISNPAS